MNRRIQKVLGTSAALAALLSFGAASGQSTYQSLAGAAPPLGGPAARQVVPITRGKSFNIDFDFDIRIGQVTNTAVADVRMVTPRQAVIMGVGYGQTDVQFYDARGRMAMTVDVRVEQDISALDQNLARAVPNARITTQSINDNIILTGTVANAADADRAVQMAAIFAASPDKVRNFLTITGNDQVMVKIQVVEVNRSAIKQLGFNTNAIFGQLGMDQYVIGNTPSYAVNGGFQGGFAGGYSLNTTSQPVIDPTAMFQGLATVPFGNTGIQPSTIAPTVDSYLRGIGALSTAQSQWVNSYLSQYAGEIFVTDLTGATYTMADVGVSMSNLPAQAQAYLNGASTLSPLGNEWMRKFFDTLPSYNSAYSYIINPESTLIDRTNPANNVATGRAGSTGLNQAQALLQAFEREGLVRTLAEPNLTTISGQAARFLAGGEYPVPTGRDSTGNVSVEFKPFGVGLGFTPVVLSDGRISLAINTEVSELTTQYALTLGGAAGAGTAQVIPSLNVRRAESTVELPAGGSIMLAGLLREETRQNIDKVPGISDVPILGALARSRDYLSNETELVIIATVYLVNPTSRSNLQTPADGLQIASDMETVLLGKINRAYQTAPEAVEGRTYEGPFGHVID